MLQRYISVLLIGLFSAHLLVAQQAAAVPAKPKLIVGIVVDQMSYDFLYRYSDNYTEGGFKKLIKQGFSCEATHYNYVPTYTAPGHASIYTGSVPAVHGIISNDWFDRSTDKVIYCATDTTVRGVGSITYAGKMSPKNMLTTSICDELKLFTSDRSKVIGIALKDRAAIMPAGHLADAAYWYDGYTNAWISSTYYMNTAPQWVTDINMQKGAAQYLKQNWNTLLPAAAYKNSTADSTSWEKLYPGETASVFPHIVANDSITEGIKATPFGNSFTADFAKAAVINEQLGKDAETDFLCVSFSSTDYVGHGYGNYSVEAEDTYIRFDRDLASFITFLDKQVGAGNYLLFLTADHGVAPTPLYAEELNIPSGEFFESPLQAKMESVLDSLLGGNNWIRMYINQEIYLNDSALKVSNKTQQDVLNVLKPWLLKQEGIANVFLTDEIACSTIPEQYKQMFINGIYAKRSGNIFIAYEPNWADMYVPSGTTHGSNFSYDTHVPLLWYGWKIKPGSTYRNVNITDIAPTLAAFMHMREPSGCIGQVITELK